MPTFIVTSQKQACEIALKTNASHMLSLLDPGEKMVTPITIRPENHVLINFEDVERPSKFAPTQQHVREILTWGYTVPDDNCIAIVHCFAGISRSTAAGLALNIQRFGFNAEKLSKWLEHRPNAWPNSLIARYADDLLGLNGKLIKFVVDFKARRRDISFLL